MRFLYCLKLFLSLIISVLFLTGCSKHAERYQVSCPKDDCGQNLALYDMREDLEPERMTIAMWDYSWLNGHYPGGPFEDWAKCVEELKERKFNTIRIDCFPLLLWYHKKNGTKYHVPKMPDMTWGFSEVEHEHDIGAELVKFMKICKKKEVYVILSSWGSGRQHIETKEQFWEAWDMTIALLEKEDLLSHVAFVDFDQEFPFMSPFKDEIEALKEQKVSSGDSAMEEAGKAAASDWKYAWNPAQMAYVKDLISSTLREFQAEYPQLRYTYSLTGYWNEIRSMNIYELDVLELHFFMHEPRYDIRTQFYTNKLNRTGEDYEKYMKRVKQTMKAVGPMIMQRQHQRIQEAMEWSQQANAPLVTTEAWGPWWHMDHPDLQWQWLYDWCEANMKAAENYMFWGITPWNYAHPYWDNWNNVEWYRRVNGRFLSSK